MIDVQYRIDGLAECDAILQRMPTDVAVKWVNGGLLAGSKVMRSAAQQQSPVVTGKMRDDIRIGRGRARGDNVRDYYVLVGGKRAKDAFYAHIVEGGAKPHTIVAKVGSGLAFGGGVFRVVHHPGAKANPFMERAFGQAGAPAVDAFASYLRGKLSRSGLIRPDLETE